MAAELLQRHIQTLLDGHQQRERLIVDALGHVPGAADDKIAYLRKF